MAHNGDDENNTPNNGGKRGAHIHSFQSRSADSGDIRYRKLVEAFWLNAERDIQMVLALRAYQQADPNSTDHHQFGRRLSVFRHFQERCAAPVEPSMDVVLLLAASVDSSAHPSAVDDIFKAQENLLEQLRLEPHDADFKSVCLAILPMNTAPAIDALLDRWLNNADNLAILDRLDPRHAGEVVTALMYEEGLVDMSFFRNKYSGLTGRPAPQDQPKDQPNNEQPANAVPESAAKIIPFRPRPKR